MKRLLTNAERVPQMDEEVVSELNLAIMECLNGVRFRPENCRKSIQFERMEPVENMLGVVVHDPEDITSTDMVLNRFRNKSTLDVTSISNLVEDIQLLTKVRGNRFTLNETPSAALFQQLAEKELASRLQVHPLFVENRINAYVNCDIKYAEVERFTDTLAVEIAISAYNKVG